MKPSDASEQTIFDAARQMAGAPERTAYLDVACAGNPQLRQRIEALLHASARADQFLAGDPLQVGKRRRGSLPAAPASEGPGMVIGKYKLLEKLGEGGCGVVYMAEQEQPVRRKVALKVIKLGMDTKQVVARFEAERQALALMDHPNIARVLDAGTTETGRPYFVMELVGGIKITDYCEQNHLTTPQRLALFIQVCRAIQHAHQKGVIHRDIKPSNVLVVTQDGVPVPKVIDFGIAKATQGRLTDETLFTAFEQFLGTPAYMSPEQAQIGGLDVDTRSDIYSLGVLLYELLTGKTPFDAKELLAAGLEAMRRTIQEKEPLTPSTRLNQELGKTKAERSEPDGRGKQKAEIETRELVKLLRGDLDWIVMKCLEKDRARRYETANGLARDIERHLNNEPVAVGPPRAAYRLGKFVRRNKTPVAVAVCIAIVLVLGVIVSTWEARQQSRLRQQAQAAQANEARERKKALTEAAKSEQVAQFLKEMLEGVGASKALGRDTTMLREILDKTAERVGKELTNQPEVGIELRDVLAGTYEELGLYQQMEEMARENLRSARAHFGSEHAETARALNTLGQAQHLLGNYSLAETTLREALAMRRKLLGNEHCDVSQSLADLGFLLSDQSRVAEAEPLQREALGIVRKRLGDEALDVATHLDNLGVTLWRQARLAEAETAYRKALAIRQKRLGSEHPVVAGSLHNLATLLDGQGKYGESEPLHREAVALARKYYGNEHPHLASALDSQALALAHQGKFAEADAASREGLTIRRKALGNEHPEVATSLHNLAQVLLEQNKVAEAEGVSREAVAILRKLPASEDSLATSLNNLAAALMRQEKPSEAETFAREALTIRQKLLGNDHPAVALCLRNLAAVLQGQGKLAEAEPLARQALAIRRQVLGDPHPAVADSLTALISILQQEGKLAEAETLSRDQLLAVRVRATADESQLASVLASLVQTLVMEGKWTEAEPPARECLRIREKKLPEDWRTFFTRSLLGASLSGQLRHAEAEPLLLSGYEGMKERETRLGFDGILCLKQALQALVQLYRTTGRSAQATEWNKRLAEHEEAEIQKTRLNSRPGERPP